MSRKASVFGIDGKEYESVELPRIFETPFRTGGHPQSICKSIVAFFSGAGTLSISR